mgnify:CR=1 FL=1
MVDEERFLTRIGRVEADLVELRSMKGTTAEQLTADLRLRWAAERGLHVVIEGLLDLGEHVLASEFGVQTSTYRETALRMVEKGIVTGPVASTFPDTASFRNVLVHEYIRIEMKVLERLLGSGIEDLSAVARDLRDRAWMRR